MKKKKKSTNMDVYDACDQESDDILLYSGLYF